MEAQSPTVANVTKEVFNQWQNEHRVYYEKTTTDASFRKIFNASGDDVQPMTADFLTSILKIQFPNRDLDAREVNLQSPDINCEVRSKSDAKKDATQDKKNSTKPQNLEVDAIFSAKVDKFYEEGDNPRIVSIIIEMQVNKQKFGTRLIHYASIELSKQKIDLPKGDIPKPVVTVGLCMWNGGQFFTREQQSYSHLLDAEDEPSANSTSTHLRTIFLDTVKNYGISDELRIEARNALKKKVVAYFNNEADINSEEKLNSEYKNLSDREKSVYEWLEFVSCGHLMTPADVEKLTNEQVKKAYDMNIIKSDYDRKRIQETMTLEEANAAMNQNTEMVKTFVNLVQQKKIDIKDVNPEEVRTMVQKILDERKTKTAKQPEKQVAAPKKTKETVKADKSQKKKSVL